MEFIFKPFVLNTYDDIKPYLEDLVNREVKTKEETEQWIKDYDLLQANISEDFAWRYIHQTRDTANEAYKNSYQFFIKEIGPKLQEIDDLLNKKIITLPGLDQLTQGNESYAIWLRGVRKALEMFRAENIPLKTELAEKQKEYDEIAGAMSIEYNGETLTMQQAGKYLEYPDRNIRKEVYEKMRKRRLESSSQLDDLLTELIRLRNQISQNAGYESFIEYQWDAFNRFYYSQEDVFAFHKGTKEHIVPLLSKIYEERRQKLGVDAIKPYDEDANEPGVEPLKPFETGEELLEKGIACVETVSPDFAENLRVMKANDRFDLSSRLNKAPGGYNYPMSVTLYPFIFMNAASIHQDIVTFTHEAGHAMHSFCIEQTGIPLALFRDYPIEIAEVASMSMELMGMYGRNVFYPDPSNLKRAQNEQIQRVLDLCPRVCVIDGFQHWLYKNPEHSVAERQAKFRELLNDYQPWIDWSGYEDVQSNRWQTQMHIFDYPLYYIEYGIAQLGAIGVWKNFIENRERGLKLYKEALGLGHTKPLPKLYEAAGIPFDLSPARIKELADFVWSEREKIVAQN